MVSTRALSKSTFAAATGGAKVNITADGSVGNPQIGLAMAAARRSRTCRQTFPGGGKRTQATDRPAVFIV
jgi:hypothetical protein